MINLIIVDDEETTRNSLIELVPWNELGIEAVKSAQNGLDALELAEGFKPSIMLCDILMPKMDGIELARKIRHLYPYCEIIFLSGYSDKEYLKSAIKLNAVDYLEKPVDIEALKSVFHSAVCKLQEYERKVSEDERLKDRLNENIHLLRQEAVLELILANSDINSLSDKYGQGVVLLSAKNVFAIITVKFNYFFSTNNDEKSLLKNNILKMLNSTDFYPELRFLSGFIKDDYLVLIFDEEVDYKKSKDRTFLESLLELLLNQSPKNYSISIAYSTPVTNVNLLTEAYKFTLEILKQQFYQGTNRVLHTPQTIPSKYRIDKTVLAKFKKLLRTNSVNEALNLITAVTKDISVANYPDISKIKNIYFNLVRILYEVTMQWDTAVSDEDNEDKYIWQEVDRQVTLKDLSDFLVSNIETVYKKTEDTTPFTNKIDELINYIIKNYSNNQLSIQSLASKTHLSQTYLCAFFKKSTGKTINEFITELRIEKAKELIQDNKLKLYEVASDIGFTDSNYFSSLFKKHTGFTPSEFKERFINDKNAV